MLGLLGISYTPDFAKQGIAFINQLLLESLLYRVIDILTQRKMNHSQLHIIEAVTKLLAQLIILSAFSVDSRAC